MVSIITICLNAEKEIGETINSILNLEGDNFEYIIKDGGSTDKTDKIIRQYISKFQERNIKFIYKIKKDRGIYDAMNQAIDLASGSWIQFVNAGDYFYNDSVIVNFLKEKIDSYDVIYGNTIMLLHNKTRFMYLNEHTKILNKRNINQQACFYNHRIFQTRKFDVTFSNLGDFEYAVYLIKNGYSFLKLDRTIVVYKTNGVSSKNRFVNAIEMQKIGEMYKLDNFIGKTSLINIYIKKIKSKIFSKFPCVLDFSICFNAIKSDTWEK